MQKQPEKQQKHKKQSRSAEAASMRGCHLKNLKAGGGLGGPHVLPFFFYLCLFFPFLFPSFHSFPSFPCFPFFAFVSFLSFLFFLPFLPFLASFHPSFPSHPPSFLPSFLPFPSTFLPSFCSCGFNFFLVLAKVFFHPPKVVLWSSENLFLTPIPNQPLSVASMSRLDSYYRCFHVELPANWFYSKELKDLIGTNGLQAIGMQKAKGTNGYKRMIIHTQ